MMESIPTLSFVIIEKDQFTDSSVIAETLYNSYQEYIGQSYGLFIDGQLIGTSKNDGDFTRLLEEVSSWYLSGEKGEQYSIVNSVEIVRDTYPKNYERSYSELMELFQTSKDPSSHKVSKNDTAESIAEKYGIILIHENEKEIYGDTGERCKVILDALASPNFKAAFDFANFVQCGEDTEACWEILKEHVVYIHIKDAVSGSNENVVCGTGEGKIPELLKKAIREDGYEGFLTLEPHLVLFATLQSLEVADAAEVISENKAKDGAEGYAMQYHALCDILKAI